MHVIISNSKRYGPIAIGSNKPETYPKHDTIEDCISDLRVTHMEILETRSQTKIVAESTGPCFKAVTVGKESDIEAHFVLMKDNASGAITSLNSYFATNRKIQHPHLILTQYEVEL